MIFRSITSVGTNQSPATLNCCLCYSTPNVQSSSCVTRTLCLGSCSQLLLSVCLPAWLRLLPALPVGGLLLRCVGEVINKRPEVFLRACVLFNQLPGGGLFVYPRVQVYSLASRCCSRACPVPPCFYLEAPRLFVLSQRHLSPLA